MDAYNPDQDYCSLWFDGVPTVLGGTGKEWRHCCYLHDNAAEMGIAIVPSHVKLASCVAEVSPLMAGIMFAGLMTFGWIYIAVTRARVKNVDR